MSEIKKKLSAVVDICSDLNYLRDEYEANLLFSSPPDGSVNFENLLDWLAKNDQVAKMMINLAKKLDDL